MHAGLRDELIDPALEGFGTAIGITRVLPFGLKGGLEIGQLIDALAQIVFQPLELADEITEKLSGVDHEVGSRLFSLGMQAELSCFCGSTVQVFDPGLRHGRHCTGIDHRYRHTIDSGNLQLMCW